MSNANTLLAAELVRSFSQLCEHLQRPTYGGNFQGGYAVYSYVESCPYEGVPLCFDSIVSVMADVFCIRQMGEAVQLVLGHSIFFMLLKNFYDGIPNVCISPFGCYFTLICHCYSVSYCRMLWGS